MDNFSVLIVDDETAVQKSVSAVLKRENISCASAEDGQQAMTLLENSHFDLILLDIMLPGQSGIDILRKIRLQQDYTPVILLSGRGEEDIQVEGLSAGADDYITKPFNKTVLVSKIQAIVRRSSQYSAASPAPLSKAQTKGCFTVHLDTQTLYKDGEVLPLSGKEFSLFYLLFDNADRALSKAELYQYVWKKDAPDDNMILVYIKRIRDKVEPVPSSPTHIRTIRGQGYRFFP